MKKILSMVNNIFSFIKSPFVGLLNDSIHIISGLEKVVALYYDEDEKKLQSKEITADGYVTNFVINDFSNTQKLRDNKFRYKWMSIDSLPFDTIKKEKKNLNLFDEFNNVVLCVGFENNIDKKTDLLFLYLNNNKGNFGISNSNDKLTTDEKSIIGMIIYNSLQTSFNKHISDSNTLKLINRKIYNLQKENEELRADLLNIRESYQHTIIETGTIHLNSLSSQYGVNFVLSEDAIDKLKYFTGNIDILKEQLTYSATLALNTSFGQKSSEIVLYGNDLEFLNIKTEKADDLEGVDISDRYRKTLLLLNKLENAAKTVSENKKGLTGENVGNACPTPITAPAISDALKNHQKKIVKLMQDYPDKWTTIRNEFRPVKNIIQNINIG